MMILSSKKNLRNIVIALLLIIAVLVSIIFFNRPQRDNYGNYIIEDDYIVKEDTYQLNVAHVDYDYPIIINENGKRYKLLDAESSIVSQGFTEPYTHTVLEKSSSETALNPPEELTVNFNGSDITVYFVDKKDKTEESREPVTVTGFTDYNLSVGYPKISKTKVIDYYDEETQATHKVTLSLDNVETKTQPRWVDDVKLPLTFHVYGADHYELYNEQIPHNEDVPKLQGKEYLILQMLGLDSSLYRIESFAWTGGEYESDGETKRNAVAYGSRFVGDYRANYINNNVILPAAEMTELTYQSGENLAGDFEYTINVKGIYAPSSNSVNYLLGVFLLLFFVVMVLYVIASKKENETEEIQ